jgi:uncharacterized membrane protein YdjX (TVP38/TMEM64 family)
MKRNKNWPLYLLIILGVALVLWLLRVPLLESFGFIGNRQAFIEYINGFGLLGPLVLALLHVVQILISILPGDVFYLAAGYVYGLVPGFVLNLTVTVGAGLLAFNIARRWGRPVVDRLAPAQVVDRWDAVARRRGFVFFLMSFMLPIFPTDTINYVAGLTSIRWQEFALASLLGRSPSIFIITLLGAHGTDLASLNLPPATLLLVILVIIGLYITWLTFFRKLTTEALEK